MSPLAYAAAALVGGGLLLVFAGQAFRLRTGDAEAVAPLRATLGGFVDRAVSVATAPFFGPGAAARAGAALARAGVRMRPQEWYAIRAALTVIGLVLPLFLWGSLLLSALGAAVAFLLPRAWLRVLEGRRLRRLGRQLPDALLLIANAMGAGSALYDAVRAVDETMPEPIAEEFRRINLEVELGVPLEEALDRTAQKLGSADLAMVANAVQIHRQLGGSLAEILRAVTDTMKERVKLNERVAVLTAQARASAYIVSALPAVLLLVLLVIAPGYVAPLFTTVLGLAVLTFAAAMIGLAFFVMSRISRVYL